MAARTNLSAENKIAELTDQLFPNGASGLGVATPQAVVNAPLSQHAYRQQQLQRSQDQMLPYEEYQRRYRQLMEE